MRARGEREVDVEDGEIVESGSSSRHHSKRSSSRSYNNSSSHSHSKYYSKTRKVDDRSLHDHYSRSSHSSRQSSKSSSSSSRRSSDYKSTSNHSSGSSNRNDTKSTSSTATRNSKNAEFEKELQEELASMNEKNNVEEMLEQRRAMRLGLAAQHLQKETSPKIEATPEVDISPKVETSPKVVEIAPTIEESNPMEQSPKVEVSSLSQPEVIKKEIILNEENTNKPKQEQSKDPKSARPKVKVEEEIDLFATNPGDDDELSNPQNSVNSAISGSKDNDIDLFTDSPTGNISSISHERVMDVNDWDDAEGRLRYLPGEMINDRYRIIGWYGKGTFGSVMKVYDTTENTEVAIKIARSHQQMKDAFKVEKKILKELSKISSNTYCVKLLACFSYKKHPCLVLEAMKENVRDLLGHYGNKGISLEACRAYAYQLLLSLYYLHSIGVIHADIKPDNMLVSQNRNFVKLCDFGTAKNKSDQPVPPNYGTLFYRAPEIILGYSFDTQIDVWSLGVCFVEFFTGKILFSGQTNNHMLYEFMKVKGKIPKKLLRNSTFMAEHFDLDQHHFLKSEFDKFSGREVVRKQTVHHLPDTDLLKDILLKNQGNTSMEDIQLFKDLIDKMLVFDPTKRLTPAQALEHKFFAPLKTKTA